MGIVTNLSQIHSLKVIDVVLIGQLEFNVDNGSFSVLVTELTRPKSILPQDSAFQFFDST